jgi:hypothetical protein
VPILAAAIGAGATLHVTHNVGHSVRVRECAWCPRTVIEEVRAWMRSFGAGWPRVAPRPHGDHATASTRIRRRLRSR